jgi:hypothetical protein
MSFLLEKLWTRLPLAWLWLWLSSPSPPQIWAKKAELLDGWERLKIQFWNGCCLKKADLSVSTQKRNIMNISNKRRRRSWSSCCARGWWWWNRPEKNLEDSIETSELERRRNWLENRRKVIKDYQRVSSSKSKFFLWWLTTKEWFWHILVLFGLESGKSGWGLT